MKISLHTLIPVFYAKISPQWLSKWLNIAEKQDSPYFVVEWSAIGKQSSFEYVMILAKCTHYKTISKQ